MDLNKLDKFLEEGKAPEDLKQYASDELGVMKDALGFISRLMGEDIDDETLDKVGEMFYSFLELFESLDDDKLSDGMREEFFGLLDRIHDSYEGVDEAYKYTPKKTRHGTIRSKASRVTGAKKQQYIRRLKANKKDYKRNFSKRMKAKRYIKKHKRTAGHKQTKRLWKSMHR